MYTYKMVFECSNCGTTFIREVPCGKPVKGADAPSFRCTYCGLEGWSHSIRKPTSNDLASTNMKNEYEENYGKSLIKEL